MAEATYSTILWQRRERLERVIEKLIALLDAADAPGEDLEPDVDEEEGHDAEVDIIDLPHDDSDLELDPTMDEPFGASPFTFDRSGYAIGKRQIDRVYRNINRRYGSAA